MSSALTKQVRLLAPLPSLTLTFLREDLEGVGGVVTERGETWVVEVPDAEVGARATAILARYPHAVRAQRQWQEGG